MSDKRFDEARPPEPPEIKRSVQLSAPQLMALPIMALLPILALVGVFGERWETGDAAGERLRVHVEYPTCFRTKLAKPLTVRIENMSAATLESVDVEFDPAYVENFSTVTYKPPASDAYTVSFARVPPQEARHVHVELAAENFGRHQGSIIVRTGGQSVSVPIQTTVFP